MKLKQKYIRIIILTFLLFYGLGLFAQIIAQEKNVQGTVIDNNDDPLPGVNVIVKGSTIGTVTDNNGYFSLSIPTIAETLLFSFIGMQTQEIQIDNRSKFLIIMTERTVDIEEVVAIGYGTSRKSDLTGSALRINMTEKETIPNTNITQALSGYLPGVNASSSGTPGSTGIFTIRGKNTLSASEAPLIVLDGIIYNGSLSNININDVETIDILKDASAAAVYGARAANGVLLITTKKGSSEKPSFEFNMYYGFQDITNTKRINVMNSEQFALSRVFHSYQQDLRAWYLTNPSDESSRPPMPDINDKQYIASKLRTQEEKDNYLMGNKTDWINEVLRIAPIQNYNLSVSGQTSRSNYFLSASYTDQDGILRNAGFKRQTLRANFNTDITNWFTFGINTSYSFTDNSGIAANFGNALIGSPLANIYNDDGDFTNNLAGDPYVRNPLEDTPINNSNTSHNVNSVLYGKLKIPKIKGLSYDINFSKSLFFHFNNTYYPSTHTYGLSEGGLGSKNHNKNQEWLLNNIINYVNNIGDNHRINATLVYTLEKREGEGSYLEGRGFETDILGYHSLELARNQNINTSAWDEANIAYMARMNYTYLNRYLMTATMRRDGYSGFGKDNKYANFPSIGFGWIISEEDFIKKIQWINRLKLRGSYGLNGNQGIGAYSSLSTMGTSYYVHANSTVIGIFPNAMGNAGLRWESTASFNIGLDFSLLNQRITGEIDIYKSKSSDVLVRRTVPQPTGYSQIWDNVSQLNNKGFEFAINTTNLSMPNLKWNSRFIFSLNRNEIAEIYEGVTKDIGNRWFVGEPIRAHYDYQISGVWQEEDLFNSTIISPYLPGDYKLVDYNKDKVINADDRSIIGYPDPNYRFGINNDFKYKNITLSFFLNSIQGGNGYYIDDPGQDASRAGGADRALRTNRTALFTYWTPENPVNNQPAMFYPYEGLHGTYFDRSFVRLQELSLVYNFNLTKITKPIINKLNIYFSGKNLYTWTKWPGIDPELSGDYISPMMKSYVLGMQIYF